MNEERKDRMTKLQAQLKGMSDEQRQALTAQCGVVTIEGRRLSDYNQCFLYYQREGVTVVGGYRQWLKADRQVKKGQHGMCIYIPTGSRDEGGNIIDEDMRFMFATVFDISQTEPVEVEAEEHDKAA